LTPPVRIDPAYVAKLLSGKVDPDEALMQLSSFWSARLREDVGNLDRLSTPERNAHLFLWYSGEVGNGGHAQYLMNPMGSYAVETHDALLSMGLMEPAEILRSVLDIFPNSDMLKRREDRLNLLAACLDVGLLQRADKAFYARSLSLAERVLTYLAEHANEVLQTEQG
jgi:hypothetical protein